MNWLAHLHLSPNHPVDQIGGLLPDFLDRRELAEVDPSYAPGIRLHHLIDVYTDSHPVFIRSSQRYPDEFKRFGKIVTDVLYDHFLSLDWELYCPIPREEFIASFYRGMDPLLGTLPSATAEALLNMRKQDWLGSYVELNGVSAALDRISRRMRKPVSLKSAVDLPAMTYEQLHDDFRQFYPDLIRRVTP